MVFTDAFISTMEEELQKVFGVNIPDWAYRTGGFEEAFFISCKKQNEIKLLEYYENDLNLYGRMEFASSLVQEVKNRRYKKFYSNYPDLMVENLLGVKLNLLQKIILRVFGKTKREK